VCIACNLHALVYACISYACILYACILYECLHIYKNQGNETGTLTLPTGATFNTRQEYLYLCQGWRADLRFLTGAQGGEGSGGQEWGGDGGLYGIPSSDVGYHFVGMQFSNEGERGDEWVGSEEGRRALSAGGDEMTHACGPDVYQGVCDIEIQGDIEI
jgi:hypothetical protein